MNKEIQIKRDFFQQANSLIFRGKPSHQVINLTAPEKNIEVKVIVVAKQGIFRTKRGEIAQFLVGDQTACCFMNFFNQTGQQVSEGDVLYISGAYTSFYKQSLLIYQGSCSIIRRVGKYYFRFNLDTNISLKQHKLPSSK